MNTYCIFLFVTICLGLFLFQHLQNDFFEHAIQTNVQVSTLEEEDNFMTFPVFWIQQFTANRIFEMPASENGWAFYTGQIEVQGRYHDA